MADHFVVMPGGRIASFDSEEDADAFMSRMGFAFREIVEGTNFYRRIYASGDQIAVVWVPKDTPKRRNS